MAHLGNLARSSIVEFLTIQTNDNTAKSANFQTLNKNTVRDTVIQNLTPYGCYITFGISPVTADDTCLFIPGSTSISLDRVAFTYFSVIRSTSDNVKIRISGVGTSGD